jgi:hypothetical protein
MLQNKKRGMNDTLTTEMANVIKAPFLDGPEIKIKKS